MQNAFIAELLTKPAPMPFAKLLAERAVEPLSDENVEMHDSALFDVVVEVDCYDGRRSIVAICEMVYSKGNKNVSFE